MVTINLPSTKEESTEENGTHCENYPFLASHEHDKTKIKIKITYIRQQGNDNIVGDNNSISSKRNSQKKAIKQLVEENKVLLELIKLLSNIKSSE